jgi:hypothetical protein
MQKAKDMHCAFDASHTFSERNPLKPNPENKDPSKVEMLCVACYQKTITNRSKMAMNNDKDLATPVKRKRVATATSCKSLENQDNFFHGMPLASEESSSKPSAKRKPIHQFEYSKSLKKDIPRDFVADDKDIALPPNFSGSFAETPKSIQPQGLDQQISFYFDESKPMTAAVKNDTNFVCVNDPSHNTTKYFNRTRSLCSYCNNLFLRKVRFDRQKENGLSCAFDASHKFNEKNPLMPNPLNLDKRNVEMICNLCYQKTMSIKSRDKLSQANAVELLPQINSIDELFPFELAKEIDDFDFSLLDFDIPTFPEEAFAESGLKTQIITEDIPSELVNQINSPDLLFLDQDIPLSPGFLQFMTEAFNSSEPLSLDQPITAPLDKFDPMTAALKNRSI